MKATKFSDAQNAFVLKQAEDGTSIGESIAQWNNIKLKRLVADLSLDKFMLRRVWKVSIRKACSALQIERSLHL